MLTYYLVNGSDGSSAVGAFKTFFGVKNVGDVFPKSSGSVKFNTDFQIERLRRLILLVNEMYKNGRPFNISLHNPLRSGMDEMYQLKGSFKNLYTELQSNPNVTHRLDVLAEEFFKPLLNGGKRSGKVVEPCHTGNSFVLNHISNVLTEALAEGYMSSDVYASSDIVQKVVLEIKLAIDACHEVIWYKHAVDSLLDVAQKLKMCLSAKAYETKHEMTDEETRLAYGRINTTTKFENLATGCEIVRHAIKTPGILTDDELGVLLGLYSFSSKGGQWRSHELIMLESLASKLKDIFALYGSNVLADPFKHIRNVVDTFLPNRLSGHKENILLGVRSVELMYGYTQCTPVSLEEKKAIEDYNASSHKDGGVRWGNKTFMPVTERVVSYMGYHTLADIIAQRPQSSERRFVLNGLTSKYPCECWEGSLQQFLRMAGNAGEKVVPNVIQCTENKDGSLTPLSGHHLIELVRGVCDGGADDNMTSPGAGGTSRYVDVFGSALESCCPMHTKISRWNIGRQLTAIVGEVVEEGAQKIRHTNIIKRVHLSQMLERSSILDLIVPVIATKVPQSGDVNLVQFNKTGDEVTSYNDIDTTDMYSKYLKYIRGSYDGGQLMLEMLGFTSSLTGLGAADTTMRARLKSRFNEWLTKVMGKFAKVYEDQEILRIDVIKSILAVKEAVKRFSVQANLSDDNAEIVYKKLLVPPQVRYSIESPIRLMSASSCIPPPSNNIVGVDILTVYDYKLVSLVVAILLQHLEFNPSSDTHNEEDTAREVNEVLDRLGVVQAIVDNMSPVYTFGGTKGGKGGKLRLKQTPIVTVDSSDTISYLSHIFDI